MHWSHVVGMGLEKVGMQVVAWEEIEDERNFLLQVVVCFYLRSGCVHSIRIWVIKMVWWLFISFLW